MKFLNKIILSAVSVAVFLASCDKAAVVPTYKSGNTPILSSSANSIAPTATDSSSSVIQFSWTNPGYATDSSTVKYIIEIDSSGGNFSNATSYTVSGALSDTLTGQQINSVLLSYGYKFNTPYNMDVRLVSSYANNNDQKISNTVTVAMQAYVIPPKVAPPTTGQLYIIGDATAGGSATGWNQPVPVPSQQFDQIDSVTYVGVFYLNSGGSYLLLPQNGSFSQKYAVPDATVSGISGGGSFQYYTSGGSNIPAPAATGWYTILVNFQTGMFTVTPYTGVLPTNLYIIGDATANGWNDAGGPGGLPQLTQLNSVVFTITMPLIAGGSGYLLLPTDVGDNSDFNNKYSVNTATFSGGQFGFDLPNNFPPPPANGTYTITVNFGTGLFTVQ